MNKPKLLNAVLILSSFLGYLEWGAQQSNFLIVMELELLSKLISDPLSALHPFTIIPLLGQLILLITLFGKEVSSKLTYLGIACIGLLLLMVLFVGILSLNLKIISSAIPFVALAVITILHHRKLKRN